MKREETFRNEWWSREVKGNEEWDRVTEVDDKGDIVLRMSSQAFRQTLLLYTHSE